MIDDPIDDFDQFVTPAVKPKKQRDYRTDRNNNPIAAAVTTGGKNQFTNALDQAGIAWEHGDQFPNDPKLSTIRIKGDPYEGARAILSNSNALKWYRGTTGKTILPKYGVTSSADFVKLPIDHQNDIINGIYQSEGGSGRIKPTQDDFDKYVSAQGQSTPQATPQAPDDDFDKFVIQQPKTPKVTSEVRDFEPEKLAPIKFQPADLSEETNLVTRTATGVAENARMQGMDLPKTHPNLMGQRVTAKFDHPPTAEEVDNALLEQLGKGYGEVGAKFRAEMGTPLTAQNVAIEKQPDGSYLAHARTSQGFVDALNAYAQGGRSAYENTLTSQQMGKAAVARDMNAELKRGEGVRQDLGQAGAREVGRNAQFLQNLGDLVQGKAPEDDPNARAISAATRSIPAQTTNTGALAEIPLSAAGAITRAEALGGTAGFPASAAIESAEQGPEAAYRAGIMTAPMLAAGPIAESIGANEMSPIARQAAMRGIAGAGMAAPAIASGATPLEAAKEAAVGALFPTGKRGEIERPAELGIERAPVSGVQGRGALDADRILAEREARIRPSTIQAEEANARPTKVPESVGRVPTETPIVTEGTTPAVAQPTSQLASKEQIIAQKASAIRPEVRTAIDDYLRETNQEITDATSPVDTRQQRDFTNETAGEIQARLQEKGIAAKESEIEDALYTLRHEALPEEFEPQVAAEQVPDVKTEAQTAPTSEPNTLAKPATEVPQESPVNPARAVETSPAANLPETEPPPSTTSARKAQLAQDRADLELPELPQAERRSWKNALLEAQNEGLDQRANAIADGVIRQPRALNDKETAGLTLRLQQIKNEHSAAMDAVDAAKGDALEPARQRAADLEAEFDKLSDAVKQSGTEKGRALASQKLTINQDFDLVSMLNRYKVKTGKEPTPEVRKQIETQSKRILELESQLAKAEDGGRVQGVADAVAKIDREVRRSRRQESKKALDDEAGIIRSNIAAEFMRLKTQAGKQSTLSSQGLGLLDPDGVITKELVKYVRNRVKSGVTDVAQIVDDAHGLIKEFAGDVTRRQIQEAISGYGKPVERRSELEQQIATLRSQMKSELRQADVEAGQITEKRQGPPAPPKQGPRAVKDAIQRRYQKQIDEINERIRTQDYAPKSQRGPTVLDADTQKIKVNLERAKQDFQRKLREWEYSQRSKSEKVADLAVNWSRAAKLMYVSTLGKLGSAATGRIVMSPIENMVGEIPHRLMPKLSAKAPTEGGGFSKAAEVAALWKSGRFRQVLDYLTKGSSDLDVLLGSRKSMDKEMNSGGLLGIPGRVHGAMKEYPRQAEYDRAFVKVLKNYERQGKDITQPDVQLAAKMEAFNSADRARFQQRNFISDTFNSAMGTLERKGIAGKAAAKAGRFIFPITRVPVNVVGETLNYTFGIPRAVVETAIRGGVKNLTPEQADNIMRAYKKGGVGLAVMTYAFLHPNQFGGYYQKGDKRDEKEPQFGEIMFFGKRIPKVFTHVPILEAAQFAATARRVMDGLIEKGDEGGKVGAIAEGGLAATKGLAEEVPFYETPARWFTGKEGSRGVAEGAGELARGTIPGFIQETAKYTDKDAQGNPIPRTPQGGFPSRFGQTIEMGVPGLRQRVPVNEDLKQKRLKLQATDDYRSGKITKDDLDEKVSNGELTEADVKRITKQGEMTPRQVTFSNARATDAIDRYERMNPTQQEELRDIMKRHAWTLTHSDTLTDAQKETYKQRLEGLGIEPVNPQKKKSGGWKSAFKSKFVAP